ncbi:hypothetical protein SALBM311S_12134 [Streptomyces alboniger]
MTPPTSLPRWSRGSWRHARRSTCATSDQPPYGRFGEPREPHSQVWFRTNGKLADDPLLHVVLATYVSDMTLLDSVLLAHGRGGWAVGDVVGASLDHAMWLHRPFRADEWLLYDQESPSAHGGRGLGQARIYTQDRPARHLRDPGGRGPRPSQTLRGGPAVRGPLSARRLGPVVDHAGDLIQTSGLTRGPPPPADTPSSGRSDAG